MTLSLKTGALRERLLPILFGIVGGVVFIYAGLSEIALSHNTSALQSLAIIINVQTVAHWVWILGSYVLIIGILLVLISLIFLVPGVFRKISMFLVVIFTISFFVGFLVLQQLFYWVNDYSASLPFNSNLGFIGFTFMLGAAVLMASTLRHYRSTSI